MSADVPESDRGATALAALRRFLRPRVSPEQCELCGLELPPNHDHLVELTTRRLECVCPACAILFNQQGAGRYRRVPRRADLLTDFAMTDLQWQGLDVPINLAFFLFSTPAGRVVGLYPSPGGPTESQPPADAWQDIVADNPILSRFEPDVEALLVNRLGTTPEYYRAGIDECYRLVALVRTHWRGLSGGDTVWSEVGRFFADLKQRSSAQGEPAHA
jgi:hypothetical protein